MIITNGTIVNATSTQTADVRITGELITQVAPGLAALYPDQQTIDATGMLVLPGGVDPHTHMDLSVPPFRASDDFLTGTIAAACGGTTTIIDHLAQGPAGCSLQHQIDVYHGLAQGKAVIDYAFHGVIGRVDDSILQQMETLPSLGVTSLKFYLTYDNRVSDEEIIRLLARAKELDILCCVHCENHAMLSWLSQRLVSQGKTSQAYHPQSRPPACEAEAVFRVLSLAHAAGYPGDSAPLYLVHVSSAAGFLASQCLPFPTHAILETCPQYLVLDDTLYAPEAADTDQGRQGDDPSVTFPASPGHGDASPAGHGDGSPVTTARQGNGPSATSPSVAQDDDKNGLKFIMSPPLRKTFDQDVLWQALAEGRIDTIGTDHCPFWLDPDKLQGASDFTQCPNGIPGVELRLALIHSEGVIKRGLPLERFVQVCSTAPAQRFGLYPRKGAIAVGSDADLVIFDPHKEVTVTHSLLHERVDYTPYEGMHLIGYPITTISRGSIVMQNGTFTGAPGQGRFLPCGPPQLP